MGTCKAGDIRISFRSEPLAPVLSIIAQRAGSKLVAYNSKVHAGACSSLERRQRRRRLS